MGGSSKGRAALLLLTWVAVASLGQPVAAQTASDTNTVPRLPAANPTRFFLRPLAMDAAVREARSNQGYLAQDEPVLHFGIAGLSRVTVVVEFLGGPTVTRGALATNQTITVAP